MSNKAETNNPPGTRRTIERKLTIDVEAFVKVFSVLATVAGIGVGVWQFTTQQENNNKMEFRRRTWEKQMETYTALGTLVSEAVNMQEDTCELQVVLKKAKTFRLARLSIYQDTVIEGRMDDLMHVMEQKIAGFRDLSDPDPIYTKGYALMHRSAKYLRDNDNELSH